MTDHGPVHALLRIVQEYGADDLYKCSDSILLAFAKNVLCHVNGKSDWDQKVKLTSAKLSDFITVSDEAFAMILIENSAQKWLFQARNPNYKKEGKKVPSSKYTEQKGISGWKDAGITRFTELCKLCQKCRTTTIDQGSSTNEEDEGSSTNEEDSGPATLFSNLESIVRNEYWEANIDGSTEHQRISAKELERQQLDKKLSEKRNYEEMMNNENSLLMMSMGKGLDVSNDYSTNNCQRLDKRSRLQSDSNSSTPHDGTSTPDANSLQRI